jgi:hypothetical protein
MDAIVAWVAANQFRKLVRLGASIPAFFARAALLFLQGRGAVWADVLRNGLSFRVPIAVSGITNHF